MLESLLTHRASLIELERWQKIDDPTGTSVEYTTIAALERRVAEVRARMAWFEEAARGNPLPRLETW